ncbi:glycosyltransferase [Egicoccus halophilus]|uniref:Glycosyl transferase n=1 Tax=Egicoccus halophilus TaxID=1670830 RepID=A0A8J3A6J3_9ACTN|nr:glycosyltransferase [Egicoccus halophilus]GGI04559.1 glycosyl transferase [Egicoccus halophilus]
MRILLWHVHGSWTTSFVSGEHTYLLPVLPDRGPYGRGRAQTWDWPANAVEVSPAEAAEADVDLVVLQRPEELTGLAETWLGGRVPGRDLPAVYVEHNAPQGRINDLRHPACDRDDLVVAHVTHFNALLWDTGRTRSTVVEHGIVDPGERYTGELDRAAAMANEPGRRARVTGTDLLPRFEAMVPVDLYGLGTEEVGGHGNLTHEELHDVIGRRRLYLHPYRWTSLGLALLEAMHVGMPVVTLDTTEASEAIPSGAGIVSNRFDVLEAGIRELRNDPEHARAMGKAARAAALERFGLARFLADWDQLLQEVVR